MAPDKNIETGITFLGQILASATHEIKNHLAIINENAGLLGDLSLMDPMALAPDRTNGISLKIAEQVRHADLVLKRMNEFSHSVDLCDQPVDLEQTAAFVIKFGSRLIKMAGIEIKLMPAPSPLMVSTHLFFLEYLIWQPINACIDNPKKIKQLGISFESSSSGALIWFSAKNENRLLNPFDTPKNKALLEHLGICPQIKNNNRDLGLLWPCPDE
ncbi:MAG: hypothetical protein HUK40_23680 [Desulfobacter sp.]|nr:hypothetical protein [Desulfobacter sp.]WDP86759.1 MAG: hypothetical protein HUN05_17875 [Desulfobacter sp.]